MAFLKHGSASLDGTALLACAAYQRAVHDQKLAMEISAAKRERDFYLSRVDKSKGIKAIKKRKREQSEAAAAATSAQDGAAGAQPAEAAAKPARTLRGWGQRQPKADSAAPEAQALPEGLLSLIAGKRKA